MLVVWCWLVGSCGVQDLLLTVLRLLFFQLVVVLPLFLVWSFLFHVSDTE